MKLNLYCNCEVNHHTLFCQQHIHWNMYNVHANKEGVREGQEQRLREREREGERGRREGGERTGERGRRKRKTRKEGVREGQEQRLREREREGEREGGERERENRREGNKKKKEQKYMYMCSTCINLPNAIVFDCVSIADGKGIVSRLTLALSDQERSRLVTHSK